MSDRSEPLVRGWVRPDDRVVYLPAPGISLDEAETRLGLMYLALAAVERLLEQSEAPPSDVRQRLLRASVEAYRAILRVHTVTESGHCECCRCQHPGHLSRISWPCPTVRAVESALLELHDDSSHGTQHRSP